MVVGSIPSIDFVLCRQGFIHKLRPNIGNQLAGETGWFARLMGDDYQSVHIPDQITDKDLQVCLVYNLYGGHATPTLGYNEKDL